MMLKTIISFIFLFRIYAVFGQFVDTTNENYKAYYFENGTISSEGFLIEGKPNSYWITYYKNGLRKSEGNRNNFLLEGTWKFYRENGNIKSKINFKNDVKNGLTIRYDENCFIQFKESYVEGIIHGEKIEYYPDSSNNKIKTIIPYQNGKEEGIGFEYAKDGRIITVINYKKGFVDFKEKINRKNSENKKIGIWKEYFNNQRVKVEKRYKNDVLNGYSKYYNIDGKLDSAILYLHGNKQLNEENIADFDIKYNYHSNGEISNTTTYNINGKKDGFSTQYDSEGNVIASEFYRNDVLLEKGIVDIEGERQGEWETFYITGEVKSKGKYVNDHRVGKWIFFFRNGKIEQEGFYNKKGQYTGEWKWYYENGQLLRYEEFSRGKEDGELREYSNNGSLITKGEFIDGEKEGEWFYELNDHKEEGKYRYGERNGLWKFYYSNGKISFEGAFVEGNPEGKHEYYYDNGLLKREENYSYGLKDGKWIWYDKDGQETLTILYKNDIERKIDGQKLKTRKN